MPDPVLIFFNSLAENNFNIRYRDIPEEFEHADELMAEIEIEGSMPESMRYFELNGFSSPIDLEEHLARQFNAFKLFFVSNKYENNANFLNEIKNQITRIQDDLIVIKQSAKPLGDITFESLINLKIQYSNELLQFILNKNVNNTNQEVNKLKVVNPVYVFKINDTVEKRRCDESGHFRRSNLVC